MSKDLFKILPQTIDELIKSYEENEPFCVHGLSDCFEKEGLLSLPILKSFEGLLKSWSKSVDVHLPGVRDEMSSVSVSTKEAFEQFEKGQALLINDVNDEYDELNFWLANIRTNLRLSVHALARCLVYATPKGCGNSAHFDQNINFVVQIHGEKKWWVQENKEVINPLTRHVIGESIDPDLESYSKKPMPKNFIKENSIEYTLKPGSILFVPRGVWHKTKALTDSMSLNFTFTAPTWSDLLMTAIKSRITQSEYWRETARDLKSRESMDKLDFLIQNLAKDAESWRAEDILNALGEAK